MSNADDARRWAVTFGRLAESGQEDEMTTLRPFLVEIVEPGLPSTTTWLRVQAEDAGHALQQARGAVPDGHPGVARDLQRWAQDWAEGDSRCPRCDAVDTIEVGGPETRDGLGYGERWWCSACLAEREVYFEESAIRVGDDQFVKRRVERDAALAALRACRDALQACGDHTDLTRAALARANEALSPEARQTVASSAERQ